VCIFPSLIVFYDGFRTHDLTITGNEECSYWLPLYGGVCCRLAAQPHCMTQQMMSEPQGWTNVYGVLKGTNLFCYHQKEDMGANVEPVLTIGINKVSSETRIRAAEKDPHSKAQNICITNQYGGEEVMHTLAADSREDTQRWMEAFWQQFYDMSQWRQCCDDLMKIELPSPRKPAIFTPKQGSLYHEMGECIQTPFLHIYRGWRRDLSSRLAQNIGRGFCCRITLSLLRSELCSPLITMTGEVTVMRSYRTSRSTLRRCYCPTRSQPFLLPL
uniref:Rhotekin-like n=1 Tax=Sinocyclocheilus anshuiensis TaxID=1608454 RepID=A0A671LRQ1_9TELE